MVTLAEARRLALALPDAVEQGHHGFPSFRVGGKIFATQPDDEHFNVMLDEPGIHAAVATDSSACADLWWGKRLRAVRVVLAAIAPELIADLLADAWSRKAHAR